MPLLLLQAYRLPPTAKYHVTLWAYWRSSTSDLSSTQRYSIWKINSIDTLQAIILTAAHVLLAFVVRVCSNSSSDSHAYTMYVCWREREIERERERERRRSVAYLDLQRDPQLHTSSSTTLSAFLGVANCSSFCKTSLVS